MQRQRGLASVCPLVCAARPPLSSAALRLLRVCMGQSERVVETVVAQGVGPWLLECREHSEAADELDARVRATLMTQSARDDGSFACGYLEGFLTSRQISDHYRSWYDFQFKGADPDASAPPDFCKARPSGGGVISHGPRPDDYPDLSPNPRSRHFHKFVDKFNRK